MTPLNQPHPEGASKEGGRVKLTEAQLLEALRDVDANGGYMTLPGTTAQITALWSALKDAARCRP